MASMYVETDKGRERRQVSHVEKLNGRWTSFPVLGPGEQIHWTPQGDCHIVQTQVDLNPMLTGLMARPGADGGQEFYAYYSDGFEERISQERFQTLRGTVPK